MSTEQAVSVQVPGGPLLEARLGEVTGSSSGYVVCHPHPLYGGDMDNPVVVRAAEVARAGSAATLRFNFRGVGKSGGVHDSGQGEREDVKAAVAALAARGAPGRPRGVDGVALGRARGPRGAGTGVRSRRGAAPGL